MIHLATKKALRYNTRRVHGGKFWYYIPIALGPQWPYFFTRLHAFIDLLQALADLQQEHRNT